MVQDKSKDAWSIVGPKVQPHSEKAWRLVKDKSSETWTLIKPVAKPSLDFAGEALIQLARRGYKLAKAGKKLTWVLVRDHAAPPVKKFVNKHEDKKLFKHYLRPAGDVLKKGWDFTFDETNKFLRATD